MLNGRELEAAQCDSTRELALCLSFTQVHKWKLLAPSQGFFFQVGQPRRFDLNFQIPTLKASIFNASSFELLSRVFNRDGKHFRLSIAPADYPKVACSVFLLAEAHE